MERTIRQRRNDGRPLFCVIESADNGSYTALDDLSALTRDWVAARGYPIEGWPEAVHDVLHGTRPARRWVREDDDGQRHTFALVDLYEFDVLFAVSSRRQRNVVGQLTENLATNLLLELLATPGTAGGRLYGLLGAVHSSRLLRQGVPGAHVIDACREWDVVLCCNDLHVDPLVDPSPYTTLIALAQNAESANHLIHNSSAHRISAHQAGVCKFSRAVTHPVVAVHAETKAMTWDPEVAGALRDAVALLRDGMTWEAAADVVGHRIPSYRLRAEPDTEVDQSRSNVRTRTKRNAERRRAGQPELPLRLRPDGAPNPEYRPETILDQPHPGSALRALFLGGAGISGEDLATALTEIDGALDGLHPRDTTLEMLATGRFRRLMVDQEASNRSIKRYRYVEYQFPPFEGTEVEPVWVLTRGDVDFLKAMRSGPPGTGASGTLPLIGLFHVRVDTPLYTSDGIVTGEARDSNRAVLTDHNGTANPGSVAWTTGFGSEGRVYRVWFGRAADRRTTRRTLCVARAEADTVHRSLLVAISSAIHEHPEAATFEMREAGGDPQQIALRRAEQRHTAAAEKFRGCGEALASPGLTSAMRTLLEQRAVDAEAELVRAEQELVAAQAALRAHVEDTVPLGDLIDVLAAMQLPLPLDPAVARRIQARLRDLIRDPRLTIDPDRQTVRWTASLELRSDTGLILRLPLAGEFPNAAKDPWLGGPPGTFWARRCTLAEAMSSHGLSTKMPKTTRWRRHIERRLVHEAERRGVRWRGPNAVNLFVRCPYTDVIRGGLAILVGEPAPDLPACLLEEVRDVFFGAGPDLPHAKACNWVHASTKSETVGALLAMLRDAAQREASGDS